MLKEKLTALFEDMNTSDLLNIHYEYCNAVNAYDDYIYSMDQFDELFADTKPWEIARCCYYGDFNPGTAEYFKFNGYGNLVGMYEYEINGYIYIDDIIDYIIKNNDSLYNDDIQNLIDEYESEE